MAGKRELGCVSATALVVASMVGAGVFTTTGLVLEDLKSSEAVMAAWLVGGAVAILGALCYGALGRRIPESGGEYLFLSRTLHPVAGYVAGWVSLLVGFSAPMAATAYGFGYYVAPWTPGISPQWLGTLLMASVTVLHALHVRRGAWIQNVAVILKVLLILLFVGIGLGRLSGAEPSGLESEWAGVGAFAVALVLVSFSYSGWNAAVYLGSEIRQPERNLPRAMLVGALLVTLLYAGVNLVFLWAIDPSRLVGKIDIGRIAAVALGGKEWGDGVALLIALAMVTSVSATIMAGPRVYERMASDGFLPAWLQAGDGPPRTAIVFQFLVAVVMLWTATYGVLLTYIGFTLSLSTACTVAGLIRLRLREGPSFRVPGWPVVPVLFLGFVCFMAWHTMTGETLAALYGLLTLLAGVGGYVMTRRRRRAGRS